MSGMRAVRPGGRRARAILAVAVLATLALPAQTAAGGTEDAAEGTGTYLIVLAGERSADGGFEVAGGSDALSAVTGTVVKSGSLVVADLVSEIGTLIVEVAEASVPDALRTLPTVEAVGRDARWKALPSREEAVASGALTIVAPAEVPGGGPEETEDPLEPLQWSMRQIRAPEAHGIQAGSRAVDVGILDTGIDGTHADFVADVPRGPNVDCLRGRDFTATGPGVGIPIACVDNNFHGTHVAGIVAAQANEHGIVGVAPNVTLVPVKVCDAVGYCYASSVVRGITYAGTARLDVANMSFFVDDDTFLNSTEFKCMDDPVQRAFRLAVQRAVDYARMRGVTPVAALGNSDNDLAHPPEPYENDCDVVPAETQGVVGTASLGPGSEKAYYSNYGVGMTDVAAPGGNSRSTHGEIPGPCGTQVLSAIPGNVWGCFQGTSMASPHAAGVAALIVSQFGRLRSDGDVEMRPQQVESYLQDTTVDIGLPGYDECFGNGRVDALRAITHDTSRLYQPNEPCPEYTE